MLKTAIILFIVLITLQANEKKDSLEQCTVVKNVGFLKNLNPIKYPYVEVLGYSTPNDGGNGKFYWDAGSTEDENFGTVIKLVPFEKKGRYLRLFDGPVNLKWFGAKGDGKTDDSLPFLLFVKSLKSGHDGFIPKGKYLLGTPVIVIIGSDISIQAEQNTIIYGGNYAEPMLTFASKVMHRYGLKWSGGNFDNSGMVFRQAKQSGTALSLKNLGHISISNTKFYAAQNFRNAINKKHGDSGITVTNSNFVRIVQNTFQGQPDAGIYISGGKDQGREDDGGEYIISGNIFDSCNIGVTIKRELPYTLVSNNIFYKNKIGVSTFDTHTKNQYLRPGEYALISNNIFRFTESTAVELRNGHGNIVSNNMIVDWGYSNLDKKISSRLKPAIWLRGVSNSIVQGNLTTFREWKNTNKHQSIVEDGYKNMKMVKTKCNNNIIVNNNRIGIKQKVSR